MAIALVSAKEDVDATSAKNALTKYFLMGILYLIVIKINRMDLSSLLLNLDGLLKILINRQQLAVTN
jgi:hypothetical protein